jgi:hypothetical protein
MATSTQDMVRPGPCEDIYYYDGETSRKQCFPTTVNTKYVQQFANLTGGSSVFTIPPNCGIQDVVVEFKMPNLTGANTGLALPRGWGYALVKQCSFRYGGSSQFFLTGDQLLQAALARQPSRSTADDLFTLGGDYLSGTDLSSNSINANIVLTLPHSTPSGVGKANPFPTDLLTQQVQLTIELNPVNSIFSVNPGGGSSVPPISLSSAQFVVQQVVLNNLGDALARRVDMATNAYAYPATFIQQKQQVPLASQTGSQSVALTGFRSGEVKALWCWITSDNEQLGTASGNAGMKQPFLWYAPDSITMNYAGDVYARFENASSPLWNLINGNKAPAVDNVGIVAGAPPTAAPVLSEWIELPFAQTMINEDAHYTLVHGKPITNGIIGLDITLSPDVAAKQNLKLNVSYVYNTTLLFSQGSCDYVF